MAASRAMRLAQRQARALRPPPRPPLRIGQWRVTQGLAPSPAGPGPLRDLPDWSFVDGRPSPPWRGQQRRREENEALARRAVTLSRVLEAAATRAGEGAGRDATPPLRPKGPVRTSKGLGSPSPTPDGRGGAPPAKGL